MGEWAYPNEGFIRTRDEGRRLPRRILFGNLEGAVREGWRGKEKERIGWVQSDVRGFGIAYD